MTPLILCRVSTAKGAMKFFALSINYQNCMNANLLESDRLTSTFKSAIFVKEGHLTLLSMLAEIFI
jgi:hypothetical protein